MVYKMFVTLFAGLFLMAMMAMPLGAAPLESLVPAPIDANAPAGLPLRKLLDVPLRDPNITLAPDGFYYLTATSIAAPEYTAIRRGEPGQMWTINDGIRLWRSRDLKAWEPLGLVWSLDKDGAGTWAHSWPAGAPNPGVAIWAPEIHFLQGTFWMPYCTKLDGGQGALACGLLRSVSGSAQGSYREVSPAQPLGDDDDASLFQDDDGTVYYLFGGYKIARMKPDMSGLAEAPRTLSFETPPTWGEGIFITKLDEKYVFTNAGTATLDPTGRDEGAAKTTYDTYAAVATESVYGPYSARYRAIPHDGHSNLFRDKLGQWWTTYFGSDMTAPFHFAGAGRAALVPVEISARGCVRVARSSARPQWHYSTTAPPQNWNQNDFDDAKWRTGGGAFGDPIIAEHGQFTDVGTPWQTGDIWLRHRFELAAVPAQSSLFLRHNGPVEVFLNGHLAYADAGATAAYRRAALMNAALLQKGANVLAVHCAARPDAPAYVDVGLLRAPPPPVAVAIVPTSERFAQNWRYTTDAPPGEWRERAFDDAAWKIGAAMFGQGVPGARTDWTSEAIWIRREFTLKSALIDPKIRLFHDENVAVYIDGVLAATENGYLTEYQTLPIAPAARARLTPGAHTLAVFCRQMSGGQGVDVGIVDLRPAPAAAAPAPNLLRNADFAAPLAKDNWRVAPGGTAEIQTDTQVVGARLVALKAGRIYQSLGAARPGQIYRVSATVKAGASANASAGRVELYEFKADGTPDFSRLLATSGAIALRAGRPEIAVATAPDAQGKPTQTPFVARDSALIGVVLTRASGDAPLEFSDVRVNLAPQLETYLAPVGAPLSSDFAVRAGSAAPSQNVAIYSAGYSAALKPDRAPFQNVSYGYFDFSGRARVTVKPNFPFQSYQILPASAHIKSARAGDTIAFELDAPQKLTFVFDGQYETKEVLHLFANATENYRPNPDDSKVIYYGPGYYQTGAINISQSNQTLYIAGGAYINGIVTSHGSDRNPLRGVTICGRGIISSPDKVTLDCAGQSDLKVSGIIATRAVSQAWTTVFYKCENVDVSDLKVLSPLYASVDGIDIIFGRDIHIRDSFVRSADDCIAIKGFPSDAQIDPRTQLACERIVIENSQFWSDANNALGIGAETNAAHFSDITFRDLDVLYVHEDSPDRGAISIVALNGTRFSEVLYQNIRVGPCGQLIDLQFVAQFPGPTQPGGRITGNLDWPGGIDGVTFRDISAQGGDGSRQIYIAGYRPGLGVKNVKFDNVRIDGKLVGSVEDSHFNFVDKYWSVFKFYTK